MGCVEKKGKITKEIQINVGPAVPKLMQERRKSFAPNLCGPRSKFTQAWDAWKNKGKQNN